MEIIVHKELTLIPPNDTNNLYHTPLWEIEIKSDLLSDPEFTNLLHDDSNFAISPGHCNDLRFIYEGGGVVRELLNQSSRDWMLDLVLGHNAVKPRFWRQKSDYQERYSNWFASVLKDMPGFKMGRHLDNSHVMIQMVVNLLQDNETSTNFYYFDGMTPVYRAPLKQNHGVIFANTPGAVHSISGVTKPRWILYGGVIF